MDCCLWRGAAGSVLPMKMAILQRGSPAPDDHHLRPLSTYSSPSRTMLARMLVASEEATSGSVMQKQERISPASSGFSHCAFCSSRPVARQHLHVAGVRRRAVEDLGRHERAAHDLAQRRVLEITSGRRRVRCPAGKDSTTPRRALCGFSSSMMGVGFQRSPVSICS